MTSSVFSSIEPGIPNEIFALHEEFCNDPYKKKVDLVKGAYRTDEGKPWVLPVVRKTEIILANDENTFHESEHFLGSSEFTYAATSLLLGENSVAIQDKRTLGVQTLGGTGALSIGAQFLKKCLGRSHFYLSDPHWKAYEIIIMQAGFEKSSCYRYWNAEKQYIDMDGLSEDLSKAEPNSVVLLQACAHNPTGCDPTPEQWAKIASLMKKNRLFPFFDIAYQGLASGDMDKDAETVRYFVDQGFELMCAQSFSKNFGLYGERVGSLTIVSNCAHTMPHIASKMINIAEGNYLVPPLHGSRIVASVLKKPALFQEWQSCVKTMLNRIIAMRSGLKKRLEALKTPGSWDHITSQRGMFCLIGLAPAQIEYLRKKHHVYTLENGRMNVAALTPSNLDHVAWSIHDTVLNAKG
ncbi:unnamed protein product [Bemisia tabaci]|uniref:Aspartate aminotransferase n=4 Tax=Bemisia tabaci TaxID=7038 RepID=A0A9P0F6I0_BEMTA|nr:unnamed protein product [Bemisia tabaci]